jgi:glycosyltransferase involved in cell wall biosynthesis
MRVVIDATQAGNRSGTGEYLQQLAQWLPVLATDVEAAFLWPEDVAAPPGVFTIPARMSGLKGVRYLARPPRALREADLVHYPASIGHAGGLKRAVTTIHDAACLVEPSWFRVHHSLYYRTMIGRSARKSRFVIADSHATAADLERLFGVSSDRMAVVPLGVDESFTPAPEEDQRKICEKYGISEPFFLFVGTHEPRKNLPRLVEAYDRIAGETTQSLVLAGRSGWKTEALLATLAKAHHSDRIQMPGFIDRKDLPALLSAADAFVWPSLYEGFGLPPLEAMACGTPVLTSTSASLPEVVGEAAITVAPENVDELAAQMTALANDDALRASLSAKGMQRAAEFTWKRTARLTLEIYRRILKSGTQP